MLFRGDGGAGVRTAVALWGTRRSTGYTDCSAVARAVRRGHRRRVQQSRQGWRPPHRSPSPPSHRSPSPPVARTRRPAGARCVSCPHRTPARSRVTPSMRRWRTAPGTRWTKPPRRASWRISTGAGAGASRPASGSGDVICYFVVWYL